MNPTTGSSTPNPNPATPALKLAAQGANLDEFMIDVARVLLENKHFVVTRSKAKDPTTYAEFILGDGDTDWRKRLELTPEQSKRLPMQEGVPMDLAVKFALLDITPLVNLGGKTAARQIATANIESRLQARLDAIRSRKATTVQK